MPVLEKRLDDLVYDPHALYEITSLENNDYYDRSSGARSAIFSIEKTNCVSVKELDFVLVRCVETRKKSLLCKKLIIGLVRVR